MPLHDLTLLTTHPHQLNQSDSISALLGLDRNLGLASDRIPKILIKAKPAAGDRGVRTSPEIQFRLVGLMVAVERCVSLGREQTVQVGWFVAELRGRRREWVRGEGVDFLDAGAVLDVPAFRASDEILQLILHGRHDDRLHRDQQVLEFAVVLQDCGEAVFGLGVDAPVHAQESRHVCGTPEEEERLVQRVAS